MATTGAPALVGLVGAGEFGRTFMAQARRVPGLRLALVCDQDPATAEAALGATGADADDIVRVDGHPAAMAAIALGKVVVTDRIDLMDGLPLAAVVEATGDPGAAAAVAERAIRAGFHSVMATKEAEVVAGPALAGLARRAGVVHTPVEGDQPSLLIGLVARARLLGLEVIAAGKSTEADYVLDQESRTVSAWGESTAVGATYPWCLDAADLAAVLAARRLAPLPTTTVPDLCEMAIVANHTDLAPDRPALHGPVARTLELPLLFRPAAEGGLLAGTGVVDVFTCLRRPDELGFAGGVFTVVRAPDAATGAVLASKGIPSSGDGRYLLLHNPVHLLGVEAVASVRLALEQGRSTGSSEVSQRFDLVARTSRAFSPGERLTLGSRHTLGGLEPLILPHQPDGTAAPIPYYLAAGGEIARAVPEDTLLTFADVRIDTTIPLARLRASQPT